MATFNDLGGILVEGLLTTEQGVVGGTDLVVGGRAAAATGGTAITNTVTETISRSVSIPANTLTAGKVVRVAFKARITAQNSTDTFTLRIRLGGVGGTVLAKSTAVDGVVGMVCTGTFEFSADAAPGAAVAVNGVGTLSTWAAQGAGGLAGAGAMYPTCIDPTNHATNGALVLCATIEESVANAGNSAIVEYFHVSIN